MTSINLENRKVREGRMEGVSGRQINRYGPCLGRELTVNPNLSISDVIRQCINPEEYDHAIVIHNVGSTGDLSQSTTEMKDFRVWEKMYDLNVFSSAVLNSVFMEIFNDKVKAKKLVINMTSIAAKLPAKSGAYYSSTKAAREMYFKVFAQEFPEVNVLNFSPYLTETHLLKELDGIRRTTQLPIFSMISRLAGLILTPKQVADRLVEIIRGQKYKSGDFVDYYDPLTSTILLTGQQLHLI
ncbi:sepiapterin reductase-like [Cotesia typhae]|uniref:sepiapterin reductase-like n=1 Tax=Cotesia typhae TaxID=2053667 RepID=UPI003D6978C9